MTRPRLLGIRHVALFVANLPTAERFWVDTMGYAIEWRPDEDNVYLRGGTDNLALHRGSPPAGAGILDHIGIAVPSSEDVDAWAAYLEGQGVRLKTQPKTHRDGSRSIYFHGPGELLIQIIHHAPMCSP